MYKINQRSTQLSLGIGLIVLSFLQFLTKFPPLPDFVAGAGIAIGIGLLIAAVAHLKIIPEKKS